MQPADHLPPLSARQDRPAPASSPVPPRADRHSSRLDRHACRQRSSDRWCQGQRRSERWCQGRRKKALLQSPVSGRRLQPGPPRYRHLGQTLDARGLRGVAGSRFQTFLARPPDRRQRHPGCRYLPQLRGRPLTSLRHCVSCPSRHQSAADHSQVGSRSPAPAASLLCAGEPQGSAAGRIETHRQGRSGPVQVRLAWVSVCQPGGLGCRPQERARPAQGDRSSSPTSGRSLLQGAR